MFRCIYLGNGVAFNRIEVIILFLVDFSLFLYRLIHDFIDMSTRYSIEHGESDKYGKKKESGNENYHEDFSIVVKMHKDPNSHAVCVDGVVVRSQTAILRNQSILSIYGSFGFAYQVHVSYI